MRTIGGWDERSQCSRHGMSGGDGGADWDAATWTDERCATECQWLAASGAMFRCNTPDHVSDFDSPCTFYCRGACTDPTLTPPTNGAICDRGGSPAGPVHCVKNCGIHGEYCDGGLVDAGVADH
jgi:hypothetical protein